MKLGIYRFTPQDIFKDTRAEIFLFWQWLKWILTFNPAAQHIGKLKKLLKITAIKKKKPLQQYSLDYPLKSWSVERDLVHFEGCCPVSEGGADMQIPLQCPLCRSWSQVLLLSGPRKGFTDRGDTQTHHVLKAM